MVLKNKPVGSERNQRDPKKAAAIQVRLFGGQKWTQVTNHAGARIVAAGSPAGKDVRSMFRWMLRRSMLRTSKCHEKGYHISGSAGEKRFYKTSLPGTEWRGIASNPKYYHLRDKLR